MFGATQGPSMVPAWMNGASAPAPEAPPRPVSDRALDLVFFVNVTDSSINSATRNIESICDQARCHTNDEIVQSELLTAPAALRVGLIAYRDHPPQDHVYITKNFGFTTSVPTMKEQLNGLFAAGGGDGPEAMTAALKAASDLDWRPAAAKMAILITDAPPHGIGEYGDGFPNGSPDGEDPLVLARSMSARGIALFVVACEPALSGYQHAVDFYHGLVTITSGMLVPLTTASLLSHVVVAAAGEVMDLERLHRELGDSVLERMRSLSLDMQGAGDAPPEDATSQLIDQVSMELHEKLLLRNESTKQLIVENIYRESPESAHNIRVWTHAPNVFAARPHIRKVVGSRLSPKFVEMRRAGLSASRTLAPGPAPAAATSAPSRHIVSHFDAFQAGPGISFLGTQHATTDYASLSAQTYRSGAVDDMDDEGDDALMPTDSMDDANDLDNEIRFEGDDGQTMALRQDAISLSQTRRLALQSLWRAS
ncbi:hypothetical protein MCAP1_001223 [Malassezia caprae]|uniref:VWFA domain-containing protein n=1 Tax=Malassezia caprae TaxID=1381934 RepID=A0AAF0E5T5_9BASI|nr:hypothetical protein MCAP1_001223 [Malassezia caprae]